MLDFLIKHIKNKRLLLIVWDTLNQNVNLRTIFIAKQLLREYQERNIATPDLVKAIAAWNIATLDGDIYDGSLITLVRDMEKEIRELVVARNQARKYADL